MKLQSIYFPGESKTKNLLFEEPNSTNNEIDSKNPFTDTGFRMRILSSEISIDKMQIIVHYLTIGMMLKRKN